MNHIITLKETVQAANQDQLIDLLKKAHVTTGHLNGRHIHVQGYAGHATFTDFKGRVDEIYISTVNPMRQRVQDYVEKVTVTNKDFHSSSMTPLLSLAGNAVKAPFVIAGKAVNELTLPCPEMSEEEEALFTETLAWREKADSLIDRHFTQSQNEIDQIASKNLLGRIQKSWDRFLNPSSGWKNVEVEKDQKAFNFLAEVKKGRAEKAEKIEEGPDKAWELAETAANELVEYYKYRSEKAIK